MTSPKVTPPEFQTPIDLTRFPVEEAETINTFRDLLTKGDPSELKQYVEVMKTLPSGVIDEIYFYGPPRYALISYGKPGIDALYQLSLENSLEAGHETGRALVHIAVGDIEAARDSVWPAHRYLERGVKLRVSKVESAFRGHNSVPKTCPNTDLQDSAIHCSHRNEISVLKTASFQETD